MSSTHSAKTLRRTTNFVKVWYHFLYWCFLWGNLMYLLPWCFDMVWVTRRAVFGTVDLPIPNELASFCILPLNSATLRQFDIQQICSEFITKLHKVFFGHTEVFFQFLRQFKVVKKVVPSITGLRWSYPIFWLNFSIFSFLTFCTDLIDDAVTMDIILFHYVSFSLIKN